MISQPTQLVQKLWNYCNILRDDGLSYGDYVEQLTYLLFARATRLRQSILQCAFEGKLEISAVSR
jgi:type I restriction enzyme M protein